MKLFSCAKTVSLFCLFVAGAYMGAAQNSSFYTHKNFGTYFEEFPYQQELVHFLDFQKGDVVADIGADDTEFTLSLTLLVDNISIWAEDVDAKNMNQKNFNKNVRRVNKSRLTPQTNDMHFVVGTYTGTNLPDSAFDKILMAATFHSITNIDAMLNDLNKKLKPAGKIYILEAFSFPGDTIHCGDKACLRGYMFHEMREIMARHGFYMTKMRSPETDVVDHTNCLVFERNQQHSTLFYQTCEQVHPLIDMTIAFDKKEVAYNARDMMQKTDSIKAQVAAISGIYTTYERFIRDIGTKWMKKKEYGCAINVYTAVCVLFPANAVNHLRLAEAYKANKQNDLAAASLIKAYTLDPSLE
jgi:ubiquinone/menaquinone biosynthesis C-methylase UbiE